MNDKDRELLVQTLHQAGKIGEAGFNALVRWQFVDGLTTFLTCSLAVGLATWGLWRLLHWKPKHDFDSDMKHVARAAGITICLAVICIVLCAGVQAGLRDMLAPDGAAVAWITAHR